MICTTPVVTLVVVLVLAREIVVNPGEELIGVRLNKPETIPSRLIFPVPASKEVLALSITPVPASPKVIVVLVVATVP